MIQLPNHDERGNLYDYVRNFERWVILQARVTAERPTLDEFYDQLAQENGCRWEPDGFVFDDEKSLTLFLLRWS